MFSDSDIVMVQEHHLHIPIYLDMWRHTFKKLGWHSHVEPAQPTLGKGNSGGVAILHRPWITVLGKLEVIHPARCIALPIYTRGTGEWGRKKVSISTIGS